MQNTTADIYEFLPFIIGKSGAEPLILAHKIGTPMEEGVRMTLDQARVLEKNLVDAIKNAIFLESNVVAKI